MGSFFTSPDDLIHLQQAAGLRPTLSTPFRFLSQVVYFRAMLGLFGLNPIAFHAVTLVLHCVNIGLVFGLARALGVDRRCAYLATVLFGSFPLSATLLSSAVGVNDELALAFALSALLWLRRHGAFGPAVATVLFALGMLCKESVIFLPLLVLLPWRGGDNARVRLARGAPLLVVAGAFGLLFLVLRPSGLAPDQVVYAIGFGSNVFHNLMTYAAWSVNLSDPMPDLVSSHDPSAWKVGVWVTLGALLLWRTAGRRQPAYGIGLLWWLLGLLPVLPLQYQTYRHYMYPAVPGMALIAGAGILALTDRLLTLLARISRVGSPATTRQTLAFTAVILIGLAYAANARRLVNVRMEARVPGIDLPLDPVHRRREVARRAIGSLSFLQPDQTKLAILAPEGTERVFGARSGREYKGGLPGGQPYNLLEESLDRGWGVKLFYPWVDSVAFLSRWTPAYEDFELLLPYLDGRLDGVGRGPHAHALAAMWMINQGWFPQARDHLEVVVDAYPGHPMLRLCYGAALYKTGDRAAAATELRAVLQIAPRDSAALVAQAILESLGVAR